MAIQFADRCRVNIATTGTGTITLGTAVTNFRTFAAAVTAGQLASGATIYYCIEDGTAWETGVGTYTNGTELLTRTLANSSTGSLLSLSGSAQAYLTITAPSFNRNTLDFGVVALTGSSTPIATNCALGNVFSVTLSVASPVLSTPTNLVAGAQYTWLIKQDATGSRLLTYGTGFKFANATTPALSTAANAQDIICGVSDGTNVYCILSANFA